MGNIIKRNNNKDFKKIRTNGVHVFYKPKRSRPFYSGVVYVNDVKIKKRFYSRENAEEWVRNMENIKIDENQLKLLIGVEVSHSPDI